MHEIQDVPGLPQAPAMMYHINRQDAHSEFLATVFISLSKWEPGMLQNPRIPESRMAGSWSPSRPLHKHIPDSWEVSERLQSPTDPLMQDQAGNIAFSQNIS